MARRPRTRQLPGAIRAYQQPQKKVALSVAESRYSGAPQPRHTHTKGSRLHIGCGSRRLTGWVNADAVPGVGDVVIDLQGELPRETFREIYGSHVLEHCWPQDTPQILRRLHDALLPGGTLRLSVPDLRLVVKNCLDSQAYGDETSALAVIYGGTFSRSTSAPDLHRQAFWKERLERLLTSAGFVRVREWGRGQYPEIDALRDYATNPSGPDGKSLISLNIEADRVGSMLDRLATPAPAPVAGRVDVSVLLGTVNRPKMLRDCIKAASASFLASGYTYEIVVAYGSEDDPSLPWLREQPDVVPVLGGMDGAIEAFNRAYRASRGRLICQINDDVLVDGDSIARAARHLDEDPSSSVVVFKFDRQDGKGYRHERIGGALHPNQMVTRREVCEAVIAKIGAFWGDAEHRTDKTYGGDTAFGVLCKYLGFRLESVEGVTCRDLLANDALRVKNKEEVSPDHSRNWLAMFSPFMNTMASEEPAAPAAPAPAPVVAAAKAPNLYIPERGQPPARSAIGEDRPLRLLHLSLKKTREPQTAMCAALAKIGPTVELPWHNNVRNVIKAARDHRPDVVFAQIQNDEWPTDMTAALREAVGPKCTLVLWTGDVRTSAAQPVERWLSRASREFDIILASNTTYPQKLVRDEAATAACGYLSCGVEEPTEMNVVEDATAGAVFFGTNYKGLDRGAREGLLTELMQAQVCPLTVYGNGWGSSPIAKISRPFLKKEKTRVIMRRTPITISMSLFSDLGRYTSDRLGRAAASGAVIAVERFDDMEGFALRDGENCLTWSSVEELKTLLRDWTRIERAAERMKLRVGALALAEHFTWDRVTEELLAIVRDYRKGRQ